MRTSLILILFFSLNAQGQIWKAIRTSTTPFADDRDGMKVAMLRNGDVIACGGWHNNTAIHNDVYTTQDNGKSWTQLADAPWPGTNDFLFASSVTGDTLVKWGGDNSSIINRRIDIYTNGAWTNILDDWGDDINDGSFLTGCRHKWWYYMVSPNGNLSRFTLSNPTPEVIATFTGEMALKSGIMISLPSGRLIYGCGLEVGSATRATGKLWYSDDDGLTWNFLLENTNFKEYWNGCAVTKSAVIFWIGRTDAANQKGVFWIPLENLENGTSLTDWTALNYTPNPRHAQGVCTVVDQLNRPTDAVIGVCGNLWNDSWLFLRIDQ